MTPSAGAVVARPTAPRLDRLVRGQQLIRALVERGHTYRSIAAAVGMSDRTISDFARGERAPSLEQLDQLRALA
jgi:transcriptional regulator with XRE-family HTH domain